MDLVSLVSELQLRGMDQTRIDSALRCLAQVSAVQDSTSTDTGGVLVQDILDEYPLEVVQAASELYLERMIVSGLEVYRLKWGYEDTAKSMEKQIWSNSSGRWNEYVETIDDRFLGFLLPLSYENARVIQLWKTRKDLKWFSIEMPTHGWSFLRLIDDISAVALKLDLAYSFRPFGPEGAQSERTLLHKKAFEALKEKAVAPPEELRNGIKLWKFFTEFEPRGTDFVSLMNECGLTLGQIKAQIATFAEAGLTTHYRDALYPPFMVVEKMKKEYPLEVRRLLNPVEAWISRREVPSLPEVAEAVAFANPTSVPNK